MNLQVIASPEGEILWVSRLLPGSAHDLTAALTWGIIRALAPAGSWSWRTRATRAPGTSDHPVPRAEQARLQKSANRAHAKLRAPGERASAQLKPGTSCASSAAAPGAPGTSLRPSTSCRPARSKDERAPCRMTVCGLLSCRDRGWQVRMVADVRGPGLLAGPRPCRMSPATLRAAWRRICGKVGRQSAFAQVKGMLADIG
jgi:DDE superfamily endonuclease